MAAIPAVEKEGSTESGRSPKVPEGPDATLVSATWTVSLDTQVYGGPSEGVTVVGVAVAVRVSGWARVVTLNEPTTVGLPPAVESTEYSVRTNWPDDGPLVGWVKTAMWHVGLAGALANWTQPMQRNAPVHTEVFMKPWPDAGGGGGGGVHPP